MQNWFNTLNEALESEGLVEQWPLGLSLQYNQVGRVWSNGTYITVYRDNTGRYERPTHYATMRKDNMHCVENA